MIAKINLQKEVLEQAKINLSVESLHRVKLAHGNYQKDLKCFFAEAEILDPLKLMTQEEVRSVGSIIESIPSKLTELLGIAKEDHAKNNLEDNAHDKLSFLSFLLDGMVQHNEESTSHAEKQKFLELVSLNERVNFILREKPNLLMQ